MNQVYIKNLSGSIFKIPFKLGTPYEVQAKVRGIIEIGRAKYVPADVAMYLDMDRLATHEKRREIKVTIKKARVPRLAVKPVAKNRVTKPKMVKAAKTKIEKKVEKGGS